MITLEIDVGDLQRIRQELPGRLHDALETGTRAAVRFYEQSLIQYTPARKGAGGGGGLRSSIYFRETGELTYTANPKYYFAFLDQGTGIHGPRGDYIRPVRARVLAWTADGGPCRKGTQCFFAMKVQGTRPFKMTEKAYKALQRNAERIYKQYVERMMG